MNKPRRCLKPRLPAWWLAVLIWAGHDLAVLGAPSGHIGRTGGATGVSLTSRAGKRAVRIGEARGARRRAGPARLAEPTRDPQPGDNPCDRVSLGYTSRRMITR